MDDVWGQGGRDRNAGARVGGGGEDDTMAGGAPRCLGLVLFVDGSVEMWTTYEPLGRRQGEVG